MFIWRLKRVRMKSSFDTRTWNHLLFWSDVPCFALSSLLSLEHIGYTPHFGLPYPPKKAIDREGANHTVRLGQGRRKVAHPVAGGKHFRNSLPREIKTNSTNRSMEMVFLHVRETLAPWQHRPKAEKQGFRMMWRHHLAWPSKKIAWRVSSGAVITSRDVKITQTQIHKDYTNWVCLI